MAERLLVLFDNVNNGTALYKELSQAGIECKISFSPPEIEKVCGVAVEYFNPADQDRIQAIADEKDIAIKSFYDYSSS